MKKKSSPVLTHVEIICFAIRAIDMDIGNWVKKFEGLPEDYVAEHLEIATADLKAKREALRSLYLMETGYEYD